MSGRPYQCPPSLYDGDKIGEGDASSVSSGSQTEVLARSTGAEDALLQPRSRSSVLIHMLAPTWIWIHAPAQ